MASVVKLFAEVFHGGFVQACGDNGKAILFDPSAQAQEVYSSLSFSWLNVA
jgi:hypothetical protein